ncbi:hypothetical protein G6F65_023160 [Rhizopus arrhizus]|nr:hypothetical protein G6F65_023160 [Rhizopus arrhizus]
MLAFPCSSSDTRPSTGLIEVPLLDLPRSSWPPASDTGLDRHPVRRARLLLCTHEYPGRSGGPAVTL